MVEENSVLLILPFQSSIKFISGEWQGALMSEQVCQSQKRINFVATSSLRFAIFSTNEVPWFWAHYRRKIMVCFFVCRSKKRESTLSPQAPSGAEQFATFATNESLVLSILRRVKRWCKFFRSFCPRHGICHKWHKWHKTSFILNLLSKILRLTRFFGENWKFQESD